MSNKQFCIEIGKRVRRLRKEQGFTQDELSQKADITEKFVYMIEKGERGLSPLSLYSLSRAPGVTADYLLCGEDGK